MASNTSATSTLAARYARALKELSDAAKSTDKIERDLQALSGAISAHPALLKMLSNPLRTREELGEVVRAVASAAKTDKLTLQLIAVLAKSRRLNILPAIAEQFALLCEAARGEIRVAVTSATALDKAQVSAISAALAKTTGKKINLRKQVNPEVLGGLKIQLGSELLDNTVAGKLQRLKRHLMA